VGIAIVCNEPRTSAILFIVETFFPSILGIGSSNYSIMQGSSPLCIRELHL